MCEKQVANLLRLWHVCVFPASSHTALCTLVHYLLECLMSTFSQLNKLKLAFVGQNKPITCNEAWAAM